MQDIASQIVLTSSPLMLRYSSNCRKSVLEAKVSGDRGCRLDLMAYSESKTPELNISFAMTVPKGLQHRQYVWQQFIKSTY